MPHIFAYFSGRSAAGVFLPRPALESREVTMLKLRFKNNKHNAVWLVEPKVTIGRANSNDVVLEDPDADDHHAEILVKHEHLTLVNLSGKPLRINHRLVKEKAE